MITTKEEVHAVVLKILVSLIEDFGGGFRRVLRGYKKLHQTPVGYQDGSLGS
jgi:hypothetical protein